MQKRTIILTGGDPPQNPFCFYETDDLIAADSGLQLAEQYGVTPRIALGDFDSYDGIPRAQEIRTLPVEKDDTDTHFAARLATEFPAEEVVILGGLGGRFDHSLSNLATIRFLCEAGKRVTLLSGGTKLFGFSNGCMGVCGSAGQTLSVFPLTQQAQGVTLRGVKYPLTDYCMQQNFPIGVSNSFIAQKAEISVKKGILLIVLPAK